MIGRIKDYLEKRQMIKDCRVKPAQLEEMDVIHHSYGMSTTRFCVVTKNDQFLGLEFVHSGKRSWNIMEWIPDTNVTLSELEEDVNYKYEGKMNRITRVIPFIRSWWKRESDLKRSVCGAL